jgi:adenosylcobinamide-phosphate synthase
VSQSGKMHLVTGHCVHGRAAGIALGVVVDAILGDPARGHPVAIFGRWAGALERRWYAPTRARGVAYTVGAVSGPVLLGLIAERATARRPVARMLTTALATWVVLGGTSLRREGLAMAGSLEAGDLAAARDRLTHLCARDPAGLPAGDLARATVESMAENTSDAVVAPLLWAALAGVPGALGYRAVNTLDAMVGYRSPRYLQFGWASARLDDVVNLVPARVTGVLTVLCAPLVKGSPAEAWRVLRADGARHPSPNAGRCEAAAAGALGVRLGGVNVYAGRTERRPEVGAEGRAAGIADVRRSAALSRYVGLAGAAVAVAVAGRRVARRVERRVDGRVGGLVERRVERRVQR